MFSGTGESAISQVSLADVIMVVMLTFIDKYCVTHQITAAS